MLNTVSISFKNQKKMRSSNLRVASYELRVASCELRVASCELQVASCELQVMNCELRVTSCELRVASCELIFFSFILVSVSNPKKFGGSEKIYKLETCINVLPVDTHTLTLHFSSISTK